jgi:hypothetical protein
MKGVFDESPYHCPSHAVYSHAQRAGSCRHQSKLPAVDTTVVLDEVKDANTGQVLEHTLDHYAQDTNGNVWYFGEESKEFENGKLVSKDSWKAGIQGAEPGIIMEARPQVGDSYDQENAPGVGNSPHIAQDHAEVTTWPVRQRFRQVISPTSWSHWKRLPRTRSSGEQVLFCGNWGGLR